MCLYSFLVRTGNKTPNFIMDHYDKSHTLDLCNSPLLLEILKNNLSFHPLPDSALGVGTCSWPVAAEHRTAPFGQGRARGSPDPFHSLEGGVPWQVFALDSIYSCLSQMCVLVLCPRFQIKQGSAHPAAPTSPFGCGSTSPVRVAQIVPGESLSYQFISFW